MNLLLPRYDSYLSYSIFWNSDSSLCSWLRRLLHLGWHGWRCLKCSDTWVMDRTKMFSHFPSPLHECIMNMAEFIYNINIFNLLYDRNAVFLKYWIFYSENFVWKGPIYIYCYLIVEYPRMLIETRWGCLHYVVFKKKKKSADRVAYFRITGDCELCEGRTVLALLSTASPASGMGPDSCLVFFEWLSEWILVHCQD